MESNLGYFSWHEFLQSRIHGLLPKTADVTLRMNFKEYRWAYSYFCRVDFKNSNKRGCMSRFYSMFIGETPEKNVQLSWDDLLSCKAEIAVTLSVADLV